MSHPSGVRSSYIYVQPKTRRRLHLLASATHATTPDEIADNLLNEIIESKYPAVLKVEKEIRKIESDLAGLLAKGTNDSPSNA